MKSYLTLCSLRRCIFILMGLGLSMTALAAQPPMRLGLGATFSSLSVKDPDASTAGDTQLALSGIMTLPVSRNHPLLRYWFEVNYQDFVLKPSVSDIGQEVSSLGVTSLLQRAFYTQKTTPLTPWVGVGVRVSLDDYKNRFTLDSSGFINQRYADRSSTTLGLVFNAGASFKPHLHSGLLRNKVMGFSFSHGLPLGEGIKHTQLNVFVLY